MISQLFNTACRKVGDGPRDEGNTNINVNFEYVVVRGCLLISTKLIFEPRTKRKSLERWSKYLGIVDNKCLWRIVNTVKDLLAHLSPFDQDETRITRRATYFRVSLYLKVVVTEMALHPELKYRCGVVATDSRLLGIVTNTHTNVSTTPTTPNVIGKLKSVIKTEIR